MPVNKLSTYLVATIDFNLSDIYWKQLSDFIKNKYGYEEVRGNLIVENAFKDCFQILTSSFNELVTSQKKASFYIFVNYIHEDSVELWIKQVQGEKMPVDKSEFAAVRRILKVILEQGCFLDMTGCHSFYQEIIDNQKQYADYLDRLLYVGYWLLQFSDLIAKSQLFPKSVGFSVEDELLNILTYSPYKYMYNKIGEDLSNHDQAVVVHNSVYDMINVWKDQIGVDYSILASFILEQDENPNYRFSCIPLQSVIDETVKQYNYNKKTVTDFYQGLTLSKNNALTVEECLFKNQSIERIIYRPILKYTIDNKELCLIGLKRWQEAITALTTNAIPFNICSNEWLEYQPFKEFVKSQSVNHDAILEDEVIAILRNIGLLYDRNIKSISTRKANNKIGNNIPIWKIPKVGEIDIIFTDINKKTLFICECKNNRSRFDFYNWKRDYSNFKNSYEAQLNNKLTWAIDNVITILNHLEIKNNIFIDEKENYTVKGIFIINAPTLYMYDCLFPALTLYNLEQLVNDDYDEMNLTLQFPDGKVITVPSPCFYNMNQMF